MKYARILLTAAVIVGLSFSPALAGKAGAAKNAKTDKSTSAAATTTQMPQLITGDDLDAMVKELKLGDDQAAKLKEKFAAKDAALVAWDKDNAEKLSTANTAVDAARTSKDRAAMQKATDDLKALYGQRNDLVNTKDAEIEASLPADQRTSWTGYKLNKVVIEKLRNVIVTDDQAAKIRTMANDSAKELTAKDQAAFTASADKLTEKVKAEVLTDAQREQLTATPDKTPAKNGKAAKGGAKAGGKAGKTSK